jgi:hypothetical protein
VPEPVALRSTTWARVGFVVTALVGWGAALTVALADPDADSSGSIVGSLLGLSMIVGLTTWTWLAIANCRRLIAHSRHADQISSWRGVFWWLSPGLIGVPLAVVLGWLVDNYVDPPTAPVNNDGEIVELFLWIVWAMVVIVLMARPYFYLARAAKLAHLEASPFYAWLWKPWLATFLCGMFAFMAAMTAIGGDERDRIGAAAVVLALLALPYFVWVWCGWKAMRSMDEMLRIHSKAQFERYDLYLQTKAIEDANLALAR